MGGPTSAFEGAKFILASTSPRRKELLKTFGLPFEIRSPASVDEKEFLPSGRQSLDFYRKLSADLSLRKAESVAPSIAGRSLILGADTLVILGGKPLGKPEDEGEARAMLKALSGRSHHVITGITLLESSGTILSESEITRVTFKPLDETEIEGYLRTGEPADKAGAYGIQGMGGLLVERIEGCYFNVVGLPLFRLYALLQKFNIQIFR
jgi:septum formation protein